jgi:hypothetical protein
MSRNVFHDEVRNEIVSCHVRMIPGYAAKPRRQLVLHAKTRIGRQDDFLVGVGQLVVTQSAVVARDPALTAGHVGALLLRNRCGRVEGDRIPNFLCAALPHIVREGKGATHVRSHNLEASIRSATTCKAKILQKNRNRNQLGIRSEPAILCQLGAIEPRAHHVVEKPRLRFSFGPCISKRLPAQC